MNSINDAIFCQPRELVTSLLKAEIIRHRGPVTHNKSAGTVFFNNHGAYAANGGALRRLAVNTGGNRVI